MSDNQREAVGMLVISSYIYMMGLIHPYLGALSLAVGIKFLWDIKD